MGLIALLGSCLVLASIATSTTADPLTRDQLYSQNGFLQNWVAPMPTAPIAASSANSTGASGGAKFLTQNWNTTYKTIAIGSDDISFVADPFAATANSSTTDGNSTGPVLQLNYPKGSYAPSLGPVAGGTQFYASPFGDKTPFSKMMISYDVGFPNGFNWVLGGKLPGIYGGAPYDGCSGGNQSTGTSCLTMRMMWRPSGLGEVYAYIPADPKSSFCESSEVICNDQYGKSIGRGLIYFAPGTWTRLDVIMDLNQPAGDQNGLLQVYMNGNPAISLNNIPYRSTGMVGFQGLFFSSFFGGSDPSWASPTDQTVYFKNLQLSVGAAAQLYEGSGTSGATAQKPTIGAASVTLISLVAIVLTLLAM
ncbi:hypothetical protein EMPS_08624 [Entomortierella parvispora]|uniref:Polysaccharide lyase 14 domain-containing protein n=1 Tax=Entomortierella parvispora TaxID=205924 RepID=A0A9P3HGR6_9FUNG|nr:hypothetical protein EMPS_08624 [Entomortierella parvispora]